jgi:hypothetical protein
VGDAAAHHPGHAFGKKATLMLGRTFRVLRNLCVHVTIRILFQILNACPEGAPFRGSSDFA